MWESRDTTNHMDLGHSINIIQFALDVLFLVKEIQMSTEDMEAGAARFWRARVDLALAAQTQRLWTS